MTHVLLAAAVLAACPPVLAYLLAHLESPSKAHRERALVLGLWLGVVLVIAVVLEQTYLR